ncbi:DUF4238 domain-containing protein [bacterium]|nr:DUF4238 domain-containing protein [bacterium]
MATARRHHYIPQWYLTGFTDTGKADGFITVHDLVAGNDFRTRTQGVGVQRDFNRVDIPGLEPDVLEGKWSQFEGEASLAVGRILSVSNLEDKEDLSYLLNLVALLAVRNPRTRALMNSAQEQVLRLMGQMAFSTRESYEGLIARARADGVVLPETVPYEQMKDFIDRNEHEIQIRRESNIELELGVLDEIIKLLHARNWSLFTPKNQNSHFVSCDHPVVLAWKDEEIRGPIGFGLRNTEVIFPIDKSHLLIGTFEADLEPIHSVPDELVAIVNTNTRGNAQRHVYSSCKSYLYAKPRMS